MTVDRPLRGLVARHDDGRDRGRGSQPTQRPNRTSDKMKFKPVGSDEFQNGDDRNCLVVAVEDLRAAPTPASDTSATVDDGARDQYTRERVFLEARIVHSTEGSAFELQPVTLRFRASVEPSLLGSAARDLGVRRRVQHAGLEGAHSAKRWLTDLRR